MNHTLTLAQHQTYLASKIKLYGCDENRVKNLPEWIQKRYANAIYTLLHFKDIQSCCQSLHTLHMACMDEISAHGKCEFARTIHSLFDTVPAEYIDVGVDKVELSLSHLFPLFKKDN